MMRTLRVYMAWALFVIGLFAGRFEFDWQACHYEFPGFIKAGSVTLDFEVCYVIRSRGFGSGAGDYVNVRLGRGSKLYNLPWRLTAPLTCYERRPVAQSGHPATLNTIDFTPRAQKANSEDRIVLDRKQRFSLRQGDLRHVLPRFPPHSIDMIVVDPPYGVAAATKSLFARTNTVLGNGKQDIKYRAIANDGTPEEADDVVGAIFRGATRLLKPGRVICCFCPGGGGKAGLVADRWYQLMLDAGLRLEQLVVWDKRALGLGWRWRRSYELVLIGSKPNGPQSSIWLDKTRAQSNIMRYPKPRLKGEHHPTEKPVLLLKRLIELHSKPGDVVLDPTAGGGSTLRAALEMKRRAIGIELDPVWVKLIRKRMRSVLAA